MKIAIDLTSLLPEATGVDVYQQALVRALARADHDNEYRLFVNWEDRRLFVGELPGNFHVKPWCLRPRAARLAFQQLLLPAATRRWRADVVHSPSFITPMARGGASHVLTVHDMTSFSLPHLHIPLRRSAAYRAAVVASIRHAARVLVPSRATLDAIREVVPGVPLDRFHVTPYGVGRQFREYSAPEVEHAPRRLGLPASYILHVGTLEPRKNLSRLVEAYRHLRLRGNLPEALVLVGRVGWSHDALLRQLEDPALAGAIHRRGYVSPADLPLVYAGARLFVYPSVCEGFGFPPLEAMACGVPTISSNRSSLAENLAGAAELVDPEDTDALASAMDRMLRDDALRARRRAQGLARAAKFCWDVTARETLACYASVSSPARATEVTARLARGAV